MSTNTHATYTEALAAVMSEALGTEWRYLLAAEKRDYIKMAKAVESFVKKRPRWDDSTPSNLKQTR